MSDVGYRSGAISRAQLSGGCSHPNAVPVTLLDGGERVATLCPDCDAQLPADWRTADERAVERLRLVADHAAGAIDYWTGEAVAIGQHATGHARNYFANGDMTIGAGHGTIEGAREHWRRDERPCRQCMQAYLDDTLHRTPTQT